MLKWDIYEVDETAIPDGVKARLLNSAFAHIMSNEASSHVVGQIRQALKNGGKASDVSTEQVKSFRENATNEAKIAEWEDSFRKAKVAAILDGTLAVRVARAPTRDPIEAAMRAIAKLEVTAVLKAHGAAFPKKDETVAIGDAELDGDTLVDRRLAHHEHGPRIRKAAERKVAEDQRLRDNATKAASGDAGLGGLL